MKKRIDGRADRRSVNPGRAPILAEFARAKIVQGASSARRIRMSRSGVTLPAPGHYRYPTVEKLKEVISPSHDFYADPSRVAQAASISPRFSIVSHQ